MSKKEKNFRYTYLNLPKIDGDRETSLINRYTNEGWIIVNFSETTSLEVPHHTLRVFLKQEIKGDTK